MSYLRLRYMTRSPCRISENVLKRWNQFTADHINDDNVQTLGLRKALRLLVYKFISNILWRVSRWCDPTSPSLFSDDCCLLEFDPDSLDWAASLDYSFYYCPPFYSGLLASISLGTDSFSDSLTDSFTGCSLELSWALCYDRRSAGQSVLE
jgi:hypothetical protein